MDAKQIGQRLAELRGERTQQEVASSIGISVSALSMYEVGERIPRDNIKIRLSNYYHCPVADLFFAGNCHET